MAVEVYIPTPFRRLTRNQARVNVEGQTVLAALDSLESLFPGLKERVVDDEGKVYRFVNIYVNGEAIEALAGPATTLRDGDEMSIIPAIAGGAPAPG